MTAPNPLFPDHYVRQDTLRRLRVWDVAQVRAVWDAQSAQLCKIWDTREHLYGNIRPLADGALSLRTGSSSTNFRILDALRSNRAWWMLHFEACLREQTFIFSPLDWTHEAAIQVRRK